MAGYDGGGCSESTVYAEDMKMSTLARCSGVFEPQLEPEGDG